MNEEWVRVGVGGGQGSALAPGPWPLLLCAISRRVAAIAHSRAFPGPQALPEQQDTSCPACLWKEAAYQGERTLCSGLAICLGWGYHVHGQAGRARHCLQEGPSEQTNGAGGWGEQMSMVLCQVPGPSQRSIEALTSILNSTCPSFPSYSSDSWWSFSLILFIHSLKQHLKEHWVCANEVLGPEDTGANKTGNSACPHKA